MRYSEFVSLAPIITILTSVNVLEERTGGTILTLDLFADKHPIKPALDVFSPNSGSSTHRIVKERPSSGCYGMGPYGR